MPSLVGAEMCIRDSLNKPDLSMEDLSDLEGTQVIFRDLGMLD